MDLAGAVLFMETTPPYCLEDTTFLRQQLAERWGAELLSVVDFYRLYYSIFFSGCKVDDPMMDHVVGFAFPEVYVKTQNIDQMRDRIVTLHVFQQAIAGVNPQ